MTSNWERLQSIQYIEGERLLIHSHSLIAYQSYNLFNGDLTLNEDVCLASERDKVEEGKSFEEIQGNALVVNYWRV